MRVSVSNDQLLISLPSESVSLVSFEPQTQRELAAGDADHAAGPQRIAQVFRVDTKVLVVNGPNLVASDRAPLVRLLREHAGAEPTIAMLTSTRVHAGFVSAVTLDPGAHGADEVACALAGLNVIASWDESERIDVELDGSRATVRMRQEGGGWEAEIVARGA